MTKIVELQPWKTPNFVRAVIPPGRREDGACWDGPCWALADLDARTLAGMCDDFRAEVFRKAGKDDPDKPKARARE